MSGQRSSHTFAVAVVLAIAAVVGALAIAAIWANDQLLDTRSWVSTSERMLESRELRQRVSAFLAEELVAETEAQLGAAGEGEVAEQVLPQLRRKAPRLAEKIVATPQFRRLWLRSNRLGHRTLVRVLDEEGAGGRGGGHVVIDLTPALRELANSLGSGGLGAFVEPGAARIAVLEAGELERAQDVVRAIRQIPVPAVIATLALFAFALLLGRANLPRTVAMAGLALALAGALALIARVLAGQAIVDTLLHREADREAAEAAWRIATSTVVDLGAAAIALGCLVALFGFLLGDTGAAWSLRGSLGRRLGSPPARLWAIVLVVLVFLALLLWQPIAAFGTPLGIALFAVAIGGGSLLLARSSLRAVSPPASHW
jgi:hypothetical protein